MHKRESSSFPTIWVLPPPPPPRPIQPVTFSSQHNISTFFPDPAAKKDVNIDWNDSRCVLFLLQDVEINLTNVSNMSAVWGYCYYCV